MVELCRWGWVVVGVVGCRGRRGRRCVGGGGFPSSVEFPTSTNIYSPHDLAVLQPIVLCRLPTSLRLKAVERTAGPPRGLAG